MKQEGLVWKISTIVLAVALAVSLYGGQVRASQPHMQAALAALRTAQSELGQAAHDKGGHRARAQQFVNQAINQVQMGIRAGVN